jgi:hypothetical protein
MFGIVSDIVILALLLSAVLALGYWSRGAALAGSNVAIWVARYCSWCLSVARRALGWIGWTWQAAADAWRKWRGRP